MARGTLIFAGPDYDLKSAQRQAKVEQLLGPKRMQVALVRGQPVADTRGLRWRPLPGATAEAEDVKKALQKARYGPIQTFLGPDALEEVFKAMQPPRILHIATHGFFLPDQKSAADGPEVAAAARGAEGAGSGLARLRQMQNPLRRSGIVLAGANAREENAGRSSAEDGYVTAEEISLMNLRGTDLVVLSACETGLGDIRTGEGVYGLRHAFLYAGARSLVTSLFEVPDVETREMMKRFYESLVAGRSKLTALHEAQLALIAERRQKHEAAHPFFWASFVLIGDAQ